MTARNAISETHDIKISRRSIPPDSLKLRDFGARGGPPNNFNPATALSARGITYFREEFSTDS